jgi:hypothetical protein
MSNSKNLTFFPPKSWTARYGDEFFTAEIIEHKIVDNMGENCDMCGLSLPFLPRSHACFKIEVRRGFRTWFVWRRFSEFISLGQEITKNTDKTATVNVNSLTSSQKACSREMVLVHPSKTLLPNLSESFLVGREKKLSEYLCNLCLEVSRKNNAQGGILLSESIIHFLDLHQHEPQ